MALITIKEIIYLAIMTFAIGYIFSGYIKKPTLNYFRKKSKWFDWENIKFAMLIVAPAVVLHELAHKFTAMLFGLTANFEIWWGGLGIGVFLKLISSPFLLVAPGFVNISSHASTLQMGITAFAGPATNLILWLIAGTILNKAKHLTRMQAITLYMTKKINLLLFIFNMIPFGPLDGAKVLTAIIELVKTSF